MELEEAKRMLKDEDCMWNNSEKNVLEAIETVLQELDNSIPKEKVKKKLKIIEMEAHYDYKYSYKKREVENILQELLEE